ncbi:MAG: biotin/lipoyl-binding protein [Puniceicoccaceae bacterium]|nr:MAG: biotin/lipoyl-binding protein [Puniceicoccaceae bacterium]
MKSKSSILVPVLFLVGLVILVTFLLWGLVRARQAPAGYFQGEVEAREIQVSGKLAGRIDGVAVRLGDRVAAGDLLFTIDSPEVEAKRRQAEAAREAAAALFRKAETGAREQEIRAAEQQLLQAEAGRRLASVTFERIGRLYEDGVLPAQRRDEAEAHYQAARAAETAARALYEMAQEGARTEDIEAAGAQERRAAAAVDEVEAFVRETRIHAPRAGEVAAILIEQGELTPAGFPVVKLADLEDIWVTFQVREDDLGAMAVGTRFEGRVPALDGSSFEFEVTWMAPLGAFATWRATSLSDGFDLKTFEVHARPVEPIPGLRPGMSVLVRRSAR